jgi:hypothetical protein
MTPEFASAVDPVFLYVLDLLDRIERGEPIARDEERIHLCALLERVESAGGGGGPPPGAPRLQPPLSTA